MSIDRWMDKEGVVYKYIYVCIYLHIYIHAMEYCSNIKKELNNAICSNMDATRDYHTKWSKSDRVRQISYDMTSVWNLKYDTNELIYKSETDSQT